MIETLIAILVLSVGILGSGWLQLAALRTSQQSAYQTTALQFAAEMADSIRANGSNTIFLSVDYDAFSAMSVPTAAPCYAADCAGADMAAFDIAEWLARAAAALPGMKARICRDAAPWDAAAHALSWQCSAPEESSAPLVVKLGWRVKNPDGSPLHDSDKDAPPGVAVAVTAYQP